LLDSLHLEIFTMMLSKIGSRCVQKGAQLGAHKQPCHHLSFRLYTGTSLMEKKEQDVFNFVDKFDLNEYKPQYGRKQEAWLQTLKSQQEQNLNIISLHQDVFAVYPRVDIIHQNIVWQQKYNRIDHNHVKNVKEMIHWHGGGGKPWPQKGTGRARHGSTRSPQWKNGGKVHGPKAPKSYFYMLPFASRVQGLTHTLTIKFLQDDIKVVDDLEIPTDEPEYLLELVRERGWGKSTLFVDTTDYFPKNITAATEEVNYFNLMPVYGLNVYSMLKHETLVLTERAVDDLTRKLIFALNRTDGYERSKFNVEGPKEKELKLEQYRPLV